MRELTPTHLEHGPAHQIRAQVRKHARSQANKKISPQGRKLDNARTHAQGGASPPPPQCKGGEWKGAVHSLQGL